MMSEVAEVMLQWRGPVLCVHKVICMMCCIVMFLDVYEEHV